MSFNASIQQLGAGLAALTAGLIIGRAPDGTLTALRHRRLDRGRLHACRDLARAAHPDRRRRRPGAAAKGRRGSARCERVTSADLCAGGTAGAAPVRHDHPVAARHRPLQVHDDAGRPASFPGRAGRVPVQVPQRGRGPHALCRRDPRRGPRAVPRCGSARTSSTTCAAGVSSRATSSTCWPLPAGRAVHRDRAASRAREREIDISIKGPVAAHDPVRGAGARDRQRGLFPQHAAGARRWRGAAAPRGARSS